MVIFNRHEELSRLPFEVFFHFSFSQGVSKIKGCPFMIIRRSIYKI